jgi:hypothetical protein
MIANVTVQSFDRAMAYLGREICQAGGASFELICDATSSRDRMLSVNLVEAICITGNGWMVSGCLDVLRLDKLFLTLNAVMPLAQPVDDSRV